MFLSWIGEREALCRFYLYFSCFVQYYKSIIESVFVNSMSCLYSNYHGRIMSNYLILCSHLCVVNLIIWVLHTDDQGSVV